MRGRLYGNVPNEDEVIFKFEEIAHADDTMQGSDILQPS